MRPPTGPALRPVPPSGLARTHADTNE